MANIGRVTPKYVNLGALPARLGRFNLGPSSTGSLPLRFVQYSQGDSRAFVSWQTIHDKQVSVAPDSTIELDDSTIKRFIAPADNRPGALLVNWHQLAAPVRATLKAMVAAAGKEIDKFSDWVLLLPHLDEGGQDRIAVDLNGAGATPAEVAAFGISGTHENIAEFFRQEGSQVLLINYLYDSTSSQRN